MKLPNGYGTCYRLPGNRRRPFVVKKTVNGRQKILGYFDTFEHGIAYLSSVNASPLLDDDITFSELFARWKATKYDRISLSSRKSYDNAYRHCRKLHNLPFRSIRYGHLQDAIEISKPDTVPKRNVVGLWSSCTNTPSNMILSPRTMQGM